MPRRARQERSTGMYHVLVRGLNKMPVFKEKGEKTRIINLIRENLSEYEVAILAYCIMPNHFHMLIKADLKELASFMAKVLAAFAHYYNYKHHRIGYVFQDRFKSQCVEKESYFWNCLRYIHRNPAKNGSVKEMLDYKYSSMSEFYRGVRDILDEKAFLMVNQKFHTNQDFLEFHRFESWDIFDDVDEDMEKNNMRIAKEILAEYKWKYNLQEEELFNYVEIRKEYKKELMKVLQISQKKVMIIMQNIRGGLIGTG